MSNRTPLKLLLALGVVMSGAGCTSDDVIFFEGTSPINAIAINRATLSPQEGSFKVTRNTAFNYSMDVHYDFRSQDFATPTVELALYGGTLDSSGNFARSQTCVFRNVKNQVVSTSSGDIHWTGSFTLPVTAACANTTWVEAVVFLFSSTSGTSLDNYSVYYQIN